MDGPQVTPTPGNAFLSSAGANPVSQISGIFNPTGPDPLVSMFNGIFYTAIAVGAMLAVLRLGYAGIIYMTSDIWHHKQSAREMISNAILGLLLLLAVWLILNQINPDILRLDILRSAPQTQTTSSSQGPFAPQAIDDRTNPRTTLADGTTCSIPGLSGPAIIQGGTCVAAPPSGVRGTWDTAAPGLWCRPAHLGDTCYVSKGECENTPITTCNQKP